MPSVEDSQKTISDAIAEFVILDHQLPDVVEGKGFQRLIATLHSPYKIPSKTKLEGELIPRIYDTIKESVKSLVSCHQGEMGLSVEEWNSSNGEYFITISVHFQQSFNPVLETKVLDTLHCGSEMDTAEWGNVFDVFFSEWDIKLEKVTAVVTATTKQEILMALAEKGLILVPCLVHTLQLCANAYFEQPEVVNILYKCRSIVAFISHNNTYKAKLRIQEQMMQLEENTLRMDYPRVWTSTYVMLEQLLIRRNIIISILTTADIVERDEFMLTQAEWKIMEEVVMVLEPFKVLIMTLSEEKTPFISLLKPLLCQLNNSHMKAKDSDSESAKKFKTFLSENLFQRYNDPKVHQLLQTATMLDARFKLLPDANEDDKNIVSGCIKEMLIKFMDEEQISNVAEEQSDERSRLSGMKFLLGDQCNSKNGMPAEEQADLEIMQYQSESIAALDHCPLQWWAQASAKCPSLARLARKYNCVPASASPPHRIPMESQVLFDLRRASLGPDLVEKLIFLNGNHSVNENVFFMPK
ncbi:Uncharacterized protein GBIM_20196 [Gryllus bimaculatus]|nr:Uncharacterized protein GBIM_20196 [Gryllus bimaculatus]